MNNNLPDSHLIAPNWFDHYQAPSTNGQTSNGRLERTDLPQSHIEAPNWFETYGVQNTRTATEQLMVQHSNGTAPAQIAEQHFEENDQEDTLKMIEAVNAMLKQD